MTLKTNKHENKNGKRRKIVTYKLKATCSSFLKIFLKLLKTTRINFYTD